MGSALDFDHINTFITVAALRNITRASEVLRMTQPALGYKLKQLERELGGPLLARHSRGVTLTPAGELFLKHAQGLSLALATAKAEVAAALDIVPNQVRIGVNETAASIYGPDLVLAGAERQVSISITAGYSSDLVEKVAAGELDAAICFDVGPPQARTVPLSTHALHLIGLRDVVGEAPEIPFEELSRFPLVLDPLRSAGRERIQALAAVLGVPLQARCELDHPGIGRALLQSKGCCAIAPERSFERELACGAFAARRIVSPSVELKLQARFRPDLPCTVEQLLLDAIGPSAPSAACAGSTSAAA